MNSMCPGDACLLVAGRLLCARYVMMGWGKLTGFSGTIAYMAATGAPWPGLSAVISIVVELGLGALLAFGAFTAPIATLFALYTIVTVIIGHHYWPFSGMERYDMWIHFYKNFSIAGGFLALASAGPGRFSRDTLLNSTTRNVRS